MGRGVGQKSAREALEILFSQIILKWNCNGFSVFFGIMQLICEVEGKSKHRTVL